MVAQSIDIWLFGPGFLREFCGERHSHSDVAYGSVEFGICVSGFSGFPVISKRKL